MKATFDTPAYPRLSDDDKHVIKRLLDALLTKAHLYSPIRCLEKVTSLCN